MTELPRPMLAPAEQLDTRTGYDRWSELYDTDENPLVAIEEPVMRELLGNPGQKDLLDVGCGTGRHTAWLASRGARVTAIDFSEGMLAKAKLKPECRDVTFLAHDLAMPLPFESGRFDVVVCGLVLDHIAALDHLFSEMRRVCRQGGFAAISVMHPAMSLVGVQARFTDPTSGKKVQCGSVENRMCDYVNAIVHSGWRIDHMSEHAVDDALIARLPRSDKYRGWPLALLFKLTA